MSNLGSLVFIMAQKRIKEVVEQILILRIQQI